MHVRYLQHEHTGTVQLLLMPLSTAASFKSNKVVDDDGEGECDSVPLPIQTFLWRQTNPFLGAKIGKLHEASCVTFERVVVQNILHGLSPSLSDALGSVSRWKLIRAALPHVIQCCGSLLAANQGEKKLPPSLQKILYILHWMLIDSASECAESSSTKDDVKSPQQQSQQGLFNISTIQLFIYLIAPLADIITEEEITDSIRLESGLKIWQAIWQFRQPDVWCFSAPVKQRRDELPMITFVKRQNPQIAGVQSNQGIYLGEDEKPRRPSIIVPPPKPPRTDAMVLIEKRRREEEAQKKEKPGELLIDVAPPTPRNLERSTSTIVRSVSEYKTTNFTQRPYISKSQTSDAFDISPTSETSAKMMQEVEGAQFAENENCSLSGVFYCADQAPLVNLSDICSGFSMEPLPSQTCLNCGSVYNIGSCPTCTKQQFLNDTMSTAVTAPPLVLTRASTTEETASSCSQKTMIPAVTVPIIEKPVAKTLAPSSPSLHKSQSTEEEGEVECATSDPTVASYLDVAVIRALLITHWHEQGVYWALRFLLNRLEEIQVFVTFRQGSRQRSNSLPSGERRPSVIPEQFPNPTWDDLKLDDAKDDGKSLHVAFNDTAGRRKSTENCRLDAPKPSSRRGSLNTLTRNRSNPSLNNSIEVLSIREDVDDDVSNVSSKSIEKENSKINAVYFPEALGSTNFIEKDGKMSATVIVQTVNQVMDRCTGVRQCELALNIADVLLRTPLEQTETFFVQLNIMVFKIYLCLGCPHGCNEGVKSQHGDFLRAKAKSILANLEKVQPEKFKTILTDYVETYSTQQVIDLVHSITAFCRSEISQSENRRCSESRLPSYRNRFNEKEKGIEGQIINATYKTLITKISTMSAELILPENMSLQQDVRMLINFVQEHHGNPFRRVGLSALIDAITKPVTDISSLTSTPVASRSSSSYKLKKPAVRSQSSKNPKRVRLRIPHIASFNEETRKDESKISPKSANDQASLRRGLFKKKDRSGGTTNEESEGDSSPSTPRTVSSMDDGVSPLASNNAYKKRSAPKLHFAFNILKTVRPDMDEENSDSELNEETQENDASSSSKRPPSKKAVRTRLPMDCKGGIRLWGSYVPPPMFVDIKKIFDGAKRFAFLLETAKPGTFPDAPLIAALLHLKSPVLARAALLLECCNFVSRCNRGQWPEWIRSSHHRTFSLGGPLANRGTPSATRRMHSLQRLAGRFFYQWAVQIGEQLSKMIEQSEKKTKKTLQMEDAMEDFFDDGLVNDASGEKCPIAVQFIAIMLLQEITAFLRETFKTIPRSKNMKPAVGNSGWDKLLSHRRWSILSNTFNAQQTGSVNSITDINSSIHLNDRERRISLSAAEEDSPRGSKDAIDEINAVDKKASGGSTTSALPSPLPHPPAARPPSLSARLFSRQSTHDESGGSAQGSTKSTTYVPDPGRRIATGRQRLLKRGTPMAPGSQPSLESSHKRKSIRNRKPSKQTHEQAAEEEKSDGTGSTIQHPQQQQLAARDSLKPTDDGLQSPVEPLHPVVPLSNPGSSHSQQAHNAIINKVSMDDEEQQMLTNLPWIKVLIKFTNSFDLDCQHDSCCTPRCFQRVHRQCYRLIESLTTLYGAQQSVKVRIDKRKMLAENWQTKQQALRRSIHTRQSAAVPRRESAMVGQPEFASKAIKALLMEKMMQEKEKEKEKEKEEKEALKKQSVEADRHSEETEEDEQVPEKNKQMLTYLRSLVLKLVHTPMSAVLKSCLLLNIEQHKQMIEISWKLLTHEDPHVVASAASMFIVASVRRSEDALSVMRTAFDSDNATERTSAIQRFYTLWRNRFHAWLKMEDGAQTSFKVPPPGIDFTLPSPAIGQSQLPVVDPPWMPHLKTKIEELSLKEEEQATSQTIMTMTRTRRKQKQEMVKRAVREAEERQCEQRQLFRLRSSAIVSLAAYEPALFHHQLETTEESETSHQHTRHMMPVAQPLFPSSLLSVVPTIIEMLDDPQVDKHGVSVGDVAKKVIWTCIVEDPSLFLRHFLEKLTNRDRQVLINEFAPTPAYEQLMSQLRKLVLRFHPLPSQAAHSLLNYLFGFVMHYVRAQCEGSEKAIGMALSICWLLSPNIHGLYFKDLKQTLKKEQCDQALMITANVPSAKKIIVHGLDSGAGGIPSQFPVHEDTQFQQILGDSLEFFNIEEDEVNNYFLTDTKTGVIHLPSAYVRDFYFFHRSFYPQLTLVKIPAEQAYRKMRETTFNQRFIEVGKVLLTHNILKYSPQHVIAQRVFFLHDEFTHLPSFPRKSLETCFGMYYGPMGEQLKAMESMHKFVWAKLMSDMFEKMENAFMFADLHLFINVINGIMIMHCEDVLILRRCAATYISISIHFNTLFASQGFFLIMPTLLRCYSQRQTNRVFCQVIEFICRQFYTLHRKPFLLQMCGAIANIIDNNSNDFEINPMRVKAKYWFNLIKKMEDMTDEDPLDILGLVPYDKPLKALDLCYRDDPNTFCVLTDAMASCICVCAFAPESKRSHHMLLIMHAMLPHMMRRLEEETHQAGNSPPAVKHEITQWITMAVEMKALVNSCESLARGPQRAFDLVNTVAERGKSFVADSPQFFDPPTTNDDENIRPYHVKEKRSVAVGWEAAEVEEQQKEAYRRPRDTLLQLAAIYIETSSVRLKELTKLGANLEHAKIPEVLDHKCYVKLGEIALALLKIAPYDLTTMTCLGLQKYFQSILPVTDWSIESNRSALNIILRRLDKTLAKIAKRQSFRRRVNWSALSAWISGICDTLNAFPYIAHLHPLKTITQLCLRIMVGDPCLDDGASSTALHPSTVLHPTTPPQVFANCVLRLTTILMQALGQFAFSLEFVTSTEGMGVSAERLEAVLCHILIPLFLRVYNNPKEQSIFQAKDLAQCLSIMQNAISPPLAKPSAPPLISTSTLTTSFIRGAQDVTGRQGSVSVTDRGHSATVSTHRIVRESVCSSIYLALKVLMLTFGKLLTTMWPRVGRIVKDLLAKKPGAPSAVAFVDFLLNSNLPIALFILPQIQNKIKQKPGNEQEAAWQVEILEKMESNSQIIVPIPVLIMKTHQELQQLKEELSTKAMEMTRSYTPTMADPHSDSSAASTAPRGAASRQSIDRRASVHAKKMLPTMKEDNIILEDVEDEPLESPVSSRVSKSPSVPFNKLPTSSSRTRSIGGFGMWRSVRRKSKHQGSQDELSDERGSMELHDLSSSQPHRTLAEQNFQIQRTPNRRSTEALVLPLHESIDTNRHRFVSFSTPKKSIHGDNNGEDVFQITEQHQLV